jgi:hypothetical protein
MKKTSVSNHLLLINYLISNVNMLLFVNQYYDLLLLVSHFSLWATILMTCWPSKYPWFHTLHPREMDGNWMLIKVDYRKFISMAWNMLTPFHLLVKTMVSCRTFALDPSIYIHPLRVMWHLPASLYRYIFLFPWKLLYWHIPFKIL